jgi:hypothetical protein
VTGSDPIRHETIVPLAVDDAFEAFTAHIGDWWPPENTFARIRGRQTELDTIRVEPVVGGRWYERTLTGDESSWGTVLDWEPPYRVALGWQITPQGLPEPDDNKASEVVIHFAPVRQDATRVQIEHRAFDRHGPDGASIWRAAMDSPEGWPKFLQRFRDYAARQ